MKVLSLLYLVFLSVCAVSGAFAQIDYATQIQPIFDAHCKNCHVPARSGWDVTNYTTVIASTGVEYASKVILPGNSGGSPIYDKISSAVPLHGDRMPRGGPYLSDVDIATIKNWIDQGAKQTAATNVAPTKGGVSLSYALSQNYPNPFNPSTTISFTIPEAAFVTLKVFDIMGREVASLVNATMKPGVYNVAWNGANAASGIYFYQLRVGDNLASTRSSFTSTKKFILQK